MNKTIIFLILTTLSSYGMARDDVSDYSISEAMSIQKVSSAIGDGVDFYFGEQKHPKASKQFGEFKTSKKTNAFAKTDKEACQWAFASAMKTLRKRAIKEGGNAVVNIRSNYKNNLTSSTATFQCGAGAVIAGVALVGDVVKLK